jgi:hypothetical protein
MLCNAVICLQNYGIAHRDIRPRVIANIKPKLEVKLYGFQLTASYLDEDSFPKVMKTDYNPPDAEWPCGSNPKTPDVPFMK